MNTFIFMRLCRLCTSSENVSSILLNLDTDNSIFADKVNAVLPGILKSDYELPNGICTTCIVQLNEAYSFIKKCSKSQEVLKQYLQHLENAKSVEELEKSEELINENKQGKIEKERNFVAKENITKCNNSDPFEFIKVEQVETEEFVEENNIMFDEKDQISCSSETSFHYSEKSYNSVDKDKVEFKQVCIKTEVIEERNSEIDTNDYSENSETNENRKYNTNDLPFSERNLSEESLNTTGKSHTCEVCSKIFARKGDLVRHSHIHTNEKRYKCEMCGKGFTQKGNLQTHIITHTNEKLYNCTFCEKTFSQKGNLMRHIRTHTQEKPYQCTICGKAFVENSHLRRHVRTHTNERPHKCETCGKAFIAIDDLGKHIRIHTNDRRFKCEFCGKTFFQSSNMKQHVRIHTDEKPFKCKYCDLTFRQSYGLKRHISKDHTS